MPSAAGASPRWVGALAGLAVALVVIVGLTFVTGTRDPEALVEDAITPRPAAERVRPSRIRTWQDRYRAEHPELLVASPKLAPLPPPPRAPVSWEPFTPSRGAAPPPFWTPERVQATPVNETGLPDGSEVTPRYPGVPEPSPPPELPPMVFVDSVPPRATIEVDGRVVGRTPLSVLAGEDVAGTTVRLSMPGYRPVSGRLREEAPGRWVFRTKLEPEE